MPHKSEPIVKVGEGLHVRMPHAMRRSVVDNVLAAGDLALGGVLHFRSG